MAETDAASGEKLVSGPPPKLDLRKAVVSATQPVPPPVPVAVAPPAVPVVPKVVAIPSKAPVPVIKLGFSAETEAKKPVAAPAGQAQPARSPILSSPVKKPSSAPPMTRVPGGITPVSKKETSKIPLEIASSSGRYGAKNLTRSACCRGSQGS
jgi:hypothetical protein